MTTEMTMVAPASTGFGVMVADWITGTEVSSVTWMVTEVDLPAWSVDVTTMVLAPSVSVMALENAPPEPTVTAP